MLVNLYLTKRPGEYYYIHGSLEVTQTLSMLRLELFRPDLSTHQQIVDTIELGFGWGSILLPNASMLPI